MVIPPEIPRIGVLVVVAGVSNAEEGKEEETSVPDHAELVLKFHSPGAQKRRKEKMMMNTHLSLRGGHSALKLGENG